MNDLMLEFGDAGSARFAISSLETAVSDQSGRSVTVIEATIQGAGQKVHDDFFQRLKNAPADGFPGRDPVTGEEKRWTIDVQSWAESGGRYTYSVRVNEKENLVLDRLSIDGRDFVPTRYKASAHNGILSISVQVTVDDGQRDWLRSLMDAQVYFPVIRRGINDAPTQMRFGLCTWSRHGTETKYLLRLVDERDDAQDWRAPTSADVWRENKTRALLFRAAYVDEIAALLVRKGLLTDAEVEQIKADAGRQVPERSHRLLETDDVDRLTLL
jgi:hypothetical protein